MKLVKEAERVTIHYVSYNKAKLDKMQQLYGRTQKDRDESSEHNTAMALYDSFSKSDITKRALRMGELVNVIQKSGFTLDEPKGQEEKPYDCSKSVIRQG